MAYTRTFRAAWRLAALTAIGSVAAISVAHAGSATFTGLGFLPGHVLSSALAVSGDGNVIVGGSSASNVGGNPCGDCEAVRWVNAGPPIGLGFLDSRNASEANGVNADGSVVVGASNTIGAHTEQAFRWVQDGSPAGGTMSALQMPPGHNCSGAFSVSGDGIVVVGIGITCYSGAPYEGFRWTNGVSTGIGYAPNYDNTIGYSVSSDGTVVVGWAYEGATGAGEAFRWIDGSFHLLGFPPGYENNSLGNSINSDGSVVVGWACCGPNKQAMRWVQDSSPSGGTMETLPLLAGGTYSYALNVSADGSTVVGAANSSTHSDGEAFRWTTSRGSESIEKLLTDAGVDIAGWHLLQANAVSADGTLIVGDGINPSGQKQGWAAAFQQDICPQSVQKVSSCVGKCNSQLSHQYGGYDAAAAALGYSSVSALQNTIKQFCTP